MEKTKKQINSREIQLPNPYCNRIIKEFLNEVFQCIPSENAYDYIKWKTGMLSTSLNLQKDEPGYQIKPALEEMLNKKVTKGAILDLVRVAKADILFDTFSLIENGFPLNHVKGTNKEKWGLYVLDEFGDPIYKLKNEILSMHLLGDEFLPRNQKKKK